jgi:L-asparagine permease
MQGVIFAYAALELVGVAAGETAEPEKVVPRAVNSIMWRVGLFYVGSVVLLALLLPGSVYSADESPFVTVLSKIGIPAAGDVMNLVVLTAAMSSLNSGLYSTGRILRSMAMAGSAPKFTARMNRSQVPYGGILLTCAVCVLGVGLNYLMPSQAFEIVLNVASLGVISTWVIIMICHLVFVRSARAGLVTRPSFRLPFSPATEITTIAFLLACLGMMWNDPEVGRANSRQTPPSRKNRQHQNPDLQQHRYTCYKKMVELRPCPEPCPKPHKLTYADLDRARCDFISGNEIICQDDP